MTAKEKFLTAIKSWCVNHNFDITAIKFADDFGYNPIDKEIEWGIWNYHDVDNYFAQFLHEYGCEWSMPGMAASFLHELGHNQTLSYFTKEEIQLCELTKMFDHGETDDEWFMERYWMIPTEFSANMWVINYVNAHPFALHSLINIMNDFGPDAWEEIAIERSHCNDE